MVVVSVESVLVASSLVVVSTPSVLVAVELRSNDIISISCCGLGMKKVVVAVTVRLVLRVVVD